MKERNYLRAVRSYFLAKLNAPYSLIGLLFLFQSIALFLSFFDQGSILYEENFTIIHHVYSDNLIIFFTLLWIFIMPFYISKQKPKESNLPIHLDGEANFFANLLSMIFLSSIGALSAVLLGSALKFFVFIIYGPDQIYDYDRISLFFILLSVFTVFLYHLLLYSFAYFLRSLMGIYKSLSFILPIVFLIMFIYSLAKYDQVHLVTFYMQEENIILFTIKVILSVLMIWLGFYIVIKRMGGHRK